MEKEIFNKATKKPKGPRKVDLVLWTCMQAKKNGLVGIDHSDGALPGEVSELKEPSHGEPTSVTVQTVFGFPLDETHAVQPYALPRYDAAIASAALPHAHQENAPQRRQADLANILNSIGPLPPIAPAQEKPTLKRLVVDIPIELHAEIKEATTRRGTTIRDEVTVILEKFFGKDQRPE